MLKARVGTALVFAPAVFAAIWYGGTILAIACVGISMLMLWEYLRMTLGRGAGYEKLVAYGLALVLDACILGWVPSERGLLVVPLGALVVLTALLLHPEPLATSVQRAALLLLGVAYCGGMLPFLPLLRHREQGLALALMALFCTWGADTGAYFAGRYAGRHKLYPLMSPGKTVEGLLGGGMAAVGVAFAVRMLFAPHLALIHVVALGLLAAVFGVLGDLCESMLKRGAGAKDSSNLIPGHGGIMDRFDGVVFVVPIFYAYALAMKLPAQG